MGTKSKRTTAQTFLGLRGFNKYGLSTQWGELIFLQVAPTNISVLSQENLAQQIRHLQIVLSILPELEIVCTDAAQHLEENKMFLRKRVEQEPSPQVRRLLQQDIRELDEMMPEISADRQFLLLWRCKDREQALQDLNRVRQVLAEEKFEVKLLGKDGIKRMLALYFGVSLHGESMPDVDGAQFFADDLKK